MIELRSDEASQSGPVRPATATSAEGQTEKHSARADVFHSSPKNGRWFKTLRASNFMEYRSEVTRLDLARKLADEQDWLDGATSPVPMTVAT